MIKNYLKDFDSNCIFKYEVSDEKGLADFNYLLSFCKEELLRLNRKGLLNNYKFVVHNRLSNSRLDRFEVNDDFNYHCIKYVFLVNRFTKRCCKDISHFERLVNLDRVG